MNVSSLSGLGWWVFFKPFLILFILFCHFVVWLWRFICRQSTTRTSNNLIHEILMSVDMNRKKNNNRFSHSQFIRFVFTVRAVWWLYIVHESHRLSRDSKKTIYACMFMKWEALLHNFSFHPPKISTTNYNVEVFSSNFLFWLCLAMSDNNQANK